MTQPLPPSSQALLDKQQADAVRRFAAAKSDRTRIESAAAAGKWESVDTKERMLAYARMAARSETTGTPGAGAVAVERILGENDLRPATFLLAGAAKTRSIARVAIHAPDGSGFGTGFLVSPRLLLTNNHVLPNESTAAASAAEFDVTGAGDGEAFKLVPADFFVTDATLDFALVAVEPDSGGGGRLAGRGWSPLIAESGKLLVKRPANVLQHPGGRAMEVALRANDILNLKDDFIHYRADTEPGSSGSPVFNDFWQVGALHHAGVPDGRGGWLANEGVRISSIVAFLKRKTDANELPGSWAQLLAAVSQPEPDFRAVLGRPGPESGGGHAPAARRAASGLDGVWDPTSGVATWTVPLRVSVSLGGFGGSVPPPPAPPTPPATPPRSNKHSTPEDMARALLQERADRPYYEADKDDTDRAAYYQGIAGNLSKAARYDKLSELLKETHDNKFNYNVARIKHLYPWVDLHEKAGKRNLRSIYSGEAMTAEEVLARELKFAAERLGVESSAANLDRILEKLDTLEAEGAFNCEHVVPQSWFNKKEPMRGDLHHLFTCESACNSFRGNIPYFQFDTEAFREKCGRREGLSKFEPVAGKGAVARATLYFLMRYPGVIGDAERELQAERLDVLLAWHAEEAPGIWEKHRNAAIFELQGNRNPLIDFPEWATKIDFARGFGD